MLYDFNLNVFISEQSGNEIEKDLFFPPFSRKIGGDGSDWLLNYFSKRYSSPILSDEKCKDIYLSINASCSELINKSRGSLLGLALGDALGTTLEFKPKGSFKKISGIVGGGPFNLDPGQWTDDTSMMYCLAHSLVRKNDFDLKDQLDLYVRWWKDGVFSSNGFCFDIGNTVRDALSNYLSNGVIHAGSSDPMSAGNGSLMRLAPVPIFYSDDFEKAVYYSGESSKSTHQAIECIDACRYYGGLIWGALNGESKARLLDGLYSPVSGFWDKNPLCPTVEKLVSESEFKNKDEGDIRASGYVMHTLEAALWAFFHTSSFEEGALMAVNLGEDADTVGAVYGQLAGAYYGERVLDFSWIKTLEKVHAFYFMAEKLTSD